MNRMRSDYVPDLVSVIIPAYNRAGLMGETLDSVRAQSYRPIEIIVVDDGSTDNTAEAVREFAKAADPDLAVHCVRQENQGAAVARNRGLAESRGEFIQFLDSDDLLLPDKFSAQVRALREDPQVQFVFSAWEHFGEAAFEWSPYWEEDFKPERDNLIDLLLQKDRRHYLPLCSGNTLFRRALCEQVGPWDTELRNLEDLEYNTRVLTLGVPHRYLPQTHLRVRQEAAVRVSDKDASEQALAWRKIRQVVEDAGLLNARRRRLLGKAYHFLAWRAFAEGSKEIGRQALADGMAVAPVSPIWLVLRLSRLLSVILGTRGARLLAALWKRIPGGLKRAVKW
jgi:glycosyltransferase involved in cell wall biosynthesis